MNHDPHDPNAFPAARVAPLHEGDPGFAPRIASALRAYFWGYIISIVAGILLGVGYFVYLIATQGMQPTQTPATQQALPLIAWTAASSLVSLVLLALWWRATAPDEGLPADAADAPLARGLSRWLWVSMLLLTPVSTYVSLNAPVPNPNPQTPQQFLTLFHWPSIAIALFAGLVTGAMITAQAFYLRWLGRRVGSRRLDTWGRMNVWLIPLLSTVGVLACGLGPTAAFILVLIHVWLTRTDMLRYHVHATTLCPGCGYDLRGSTGGFCPECGRPAAPGTQAEAPFEQGPAPQPPYA